MFGTIQTFGNGEKVLKVTAILETNRHVHRKNVRMIADETKLNMEVIRYMFVEDLGKRQVCL